MDASIVSKATFPNDTYIVSKRKLEIFSKVKEDEDFNRKNILDILRIKI